MRTIALTTLLLLSLGSMGCSGDSQKSAKSAKPSGSQTSSKDTSDSNEVIAPTNKGNPEEICEQQGRYYDLALGECTDRKLMNVTCTLDNVTYPAGSDFVQKNPGASKDFTDEVQKFQIRTLFREQLAGYTLRYCVDDADEYTLIAIKQDGGKYLVEEIPVPK